MSVSEKIRITIETDHDGQVAAQEILRWLQAGRRDLTPEQGRFVCSLLQQLSSEERKELETVLLPKPEVKETGRVMEFAPDQLGRLLDKFKAWERVKEVEVPPALLSSELEGKFFPDTTKLFFYDGGTLYLLKNPGDLPADFCERWSDLAELRLAIQEKAGETGSDFYSELLLQNGFDEDLYAQASPALRVLMESC